MTSITDCQQAIQLLQDYEIDWEKIFVKDLALRGVIVWYGDERIILDVHSAGCLRVEGKSWVCRGRRFSHDEKVSLTEWALKVIEMYGVKRYSRKKLKSPSCAEEMFGRSHKEILRWELFYVDPDEDPPPDIT